MRAMVVFLMFGVVMVILTMADGVSFLQLIGMDKESRDHRAAVERHMYSSNDPEPYEPILEPGSEQERVASRLVDMYVTILSNYRIESVDGVPVDSSPDPDDLDIYEHSLQWYRYSNDPDVGQFQRENVDMWKLITVTHPPILGGVVDRFLEDPNDYGPNHNPWGGAETPWGPLENDQYLIQASVYVVDPYTVRWEGYLGDPMLRSWEAVDVFRVAFYSLVERDQGGTEGKVQKIRVVGGGTAFSNTKVIEELSHRQNGEAGFYRDDWKMLFSRKGNGLGATDEKMLKVTKYADFRDLSYDGGAPFTPKQSLMDEHCNSGRGYRGSACKD